MEYVPIAMHQWHCHPQHSRTGTTRAAVHCFAPLIQYKKIRGSEGESYALNSVSNDVKLLLQLEN